jgi:predicted XRE-type DNA-binding protein
MSNAESYASVWDAIADTPVQAASLNARAELMQKIGARLKKHDWTQAEVASRCGVTQPRINDLLRGRVSRFLLDALVNIATALGCRPCPSCPRSPNAPGEPEWNPSPKTEVRRVGGRKRSASPEWRRSVFRVMWRCPTVPAAGCPASA